MSIRWIGKKDIGTDLCGDGRGSDSGEKNLYSSMEKGAESEAPGMQESIEGEMENEPETPTEAEIKAGIEAPVETEEPETEAAATAETEEAKTEAAAPAETEEPETEAAASTETEIAETENEHETGTGMEIEIEIGAEDAGVRIDAYLADEIDGVTRSYLQRLIENGDIRVEGRAKTAKNYKLRSRDRIFVRIPPPKKLNVDAEDIPLDIVYEDDDLLVVNKPKGMVVHPAVGNYTGTLVNALMYHCGDHLSSINGVIRPGIVHRIDKDTSGLLVAAKTDAAHRRLSQQLKDHSMTRSYRAVVYHNFKEPEGTVDAPIGRDKRDRLRMAVTSLSEGRRAVTHYTQLAHSEGFSLIECRLETGRTHQIRVHMAYIHHPLLGDMIYGPRKTAHGVQSQMLHARTLGFIHPVTGEYLEFHREPPEEFQKICRKIGLI